MATIQKCSRCGSGVVNPIPALNEPAITGSATGMCRHDSSALSKPHNGVRPEMISVSNAPPNVGGCGEIVLMLIIFFSCDAMLIHRGNDTGTNLALLVVSLLLTTAAGAAMAWMKKADRPKKQTARYCVQCEETARTESAVTTETKG